MVYHWLKSTQDFFLPSRCLLCGQATSGGMVLCPPCLNDLPNNPQPCPGCAMPLPDGSPATAVCGQCLSQPPLAAATFAPYLYRAPLSQLLQRYKFDGKMMLAPLFGQQLADGLQQWPHYLPPDGLVAVPLHPSRLRQRGFNQSLEITRILSQRLGIPNLSRHCLRIRATATQSELNQHQRRQNMRDAFRAAPTLAGRHVAIIDDVITTGETSHALARSLLAAGATQVQVWAIARALQH